MKIYKIYNLPFAIKSENILENIFFGKRLILLLEVFTWSIVIVSFDSSVIDNESVYSFITVTESNSDNGKWVIGFVTHCSTSVWAILLVRCGLMSLFTQKKLQRCVITLVTQQWLSQISQLTQVLFSVHWISGHCHR